MKMKSFLFSNFLIFTSLFAHLVFANNPDLRQKWIINVDSSTGGVEFNAVGRPSAIRVHGKGSPLKGSLAIDGTKISGDLSFELESLETGIKLRDEHMKQKYLETPKFSQAKFTLTQVHFPENIRAGDGKVDNLPIEGILALHGVQKPINGMAQVRRTGNQLQVDANFGLKIGDYAIPTPTFAGITLLNDVSVAVHMTAVLVDQK